MEPIFEKKKKKIYYYLFIYLLFILFKYYISCCLGNTSEIVQILLNDIMKCFLHQEKQIRTSSLQVVSVILRQGLVHPVQVLKKIIYIPIYQPVGFDFSVIGQSFLVPNSLNNHPDFALDKLDPKRLRTMVYKTLGWCVIIFLFFTLSF